MLCLPCKFSTHNKIVLHHLASSVVSFSLLETYKYLKAYMLCFVVSWTLSSCIELLSKFT
uniref:Uncharacterized protein n=1 Tax=Arundo donax TaxID=35708 RepID=A0A0A9FXZ2_ARUDO